MTDGIALARTAPGALGAAAAATPARGGESRSGGRDFAALVDDRPGPPARPSETDRAGPEEDSREASESEPASAGPPPPDAPAGMPDPALAGGLVPVAPEAAESPVATGEAGPDATGRPEGGGPPSPRPPEGEVRSLPPREAPAPRPASAAEGRLLAAVAGANSGASAAVAGLGATPVATAASSPATNAAGAAAVAEGGVEPVAVAGPSTAPEAAGAIVTAAASPAKPVGPGGARSKAGAGSAAVVPSPEIVGEGDPAEGAGEAPRPVQRAEAAMPPAPAPLSPPVGPPRAGAAPGQTAPDPVGGPATRKEGREAAPAGPGLGRPSGWMASPAWRPPDAASPAEVRETVGRSEAVEQADPLAAPPLATSQGQGAAPPILFGGTDGPQTARRIARQIAGHPVLETGGAAEVRLAPEELGHLRLRVETDAAGLRVVIEAARPETADLMRRHIESLRQELRQEGFGSVGVSVGDGSDRGGGEGPGARDPRPALGPAPGDGSAPAALAAPPAAAVARPRAAGTQLDIRF